MSCGLCIVFCVGGTHEYVKLSMFIKFGTYPCVLVIYGFLVFLMTLSVYTRALLVNIVSCLLDDSVRSQNVVTLRDDYECFEKYLL